MAIVITNGELYIYLSESGKCRKSENEADAYAFESVGCAVEYMCKAPAKTNNYYVYDTETQTILWKRSENELVKRKRKKYSQDTRKLLYMKAEGKCALCGKKLTLAEATIDHIVPLACGGADSVENLQICCAKDNRLKGSILPEDFFERITKIFMYQMEKKNGKTLKFKAFQWILKEMVE